MTVRVEPRRAGLSIPLTLAGLVAVLAPAIAWLHLDRLPVTVCMFKAVTGVPCMTCGATRALGLVGRLDIPGAFHINPLMAALFLGLLAFAAVELAFRAQGRSIAIHVGSLEKRVLAFLAAALVLLNWMYLIAARV
jgi:hypothetical protein